MPRRKTKPLADAEESFPFIVSNGPGTVKDPALRTLIRKQAMKDVGLARKRRGNHGKANVGQIAHDETVGPKESPDELCTNSASSDSSIETSDIWYPVTDSSVSAEVDDTDFEGWELVCQSPDVFADVSYVLPKSLGYNSGYERVRVRYGIDLTELSMLTNFNVGKSAIPFLSANNGMRLANLMRSKQWSYLEFVPQMYDSSKCLSAAADCVLAKVSAVLMPLPGSQESALRLYAKALTALQDAISNPELCESGDVLGATQLLALHELLDTTRAAAYVHHIKGSTHLVKHRGTGKFNSEFEKALFSGHVGPVMTDALLNNERCYLADPAWTKLYKSLIEETDQLTERNSLAINARLLMFYLPGLWHDVHYAVLGDGIFDDTVLAGLEQRCRELQAKFLEWLEEYKSHCVARSLAVPTMAEIGLRRELFGAALECLVIIKRLLATVCDKVRIEVEAEAQALSKLMIDLQNQPAPCHSWLFSAHEVEIAKVVVSGKEEWEKDLSELSIEEQRLAARKRYFLWAGELRGH